MNLPIGLIFCIASLAICAYAASRSLGAGISALWAIGCFYGIVRANFLDGFSHFMFDAGMFGFYAVTFVRPVSEKTELDSRKAKSWLLLLLGWPIILFFLPINHYLVQMVGLR